MDGFAFSTELTVRFAETDAQGIAHNAVFLVWYEVARIDYLARYTGGYQKIRDEGLEALTIEAHVRYLAPVRFDDRLRIHTRSGDLRGARFRFDYAVERAGDVVADGWTLHALVDARTLRPTRVPPWLAEAIRRADPGSASRLRPRS